MYKVVDLFAGAGGLSLGFMQTKKYDIKVAFENNPNMQATYKKNHASVDVRGDVCSANYDEIREKYRKVDAQCEDFVDLLISNNTFRIESPIYRNKTAYFLTGFETFELWKAIIQSFMYTGKYLWIYGRKNMKLFGGNFKELFDYLEEKSLNNQMFGIDFRCLFLNPNSDEVKHAHKQQDIFLPELKATIKRAKYQIGDNQLLQKCFRMYSNRREEIIIRLDNCIIYAKPHFDENGYPQLMTDTKFEIFSASSPRGQECIRKFSNIWNEAINLF